MYVVYLRLGAMTLVLNAWEDYWLAFQEVESLNKRDYKAYYFVRYKENFDGKDYDFRPRDYTKYRMVKKFNGKKVIVAWCISCEA